MTDLFSEQTSSNSKFEEVNAQTNEASALLANGLFDQAIKAFEQVIEEHPRNWRAYQNIGVAYLMKKQFDKAIEYLDVYRQNKPKDPIGHDTLGVCYSEKNDSIKAICCFQNAINLDDTFYISHYNLGVVLGKLELNTLAIESYHKCLELNPVYANALNNIGDIVRKLGKYQDASVIFETLIEIQPTYLLAYKNLAFCQFELQNYTESFLNYKKHLENEFGPQTSPFVVINMAKCLIYYDFYREAIGAVNLYTKISGGQKIAPQFQNFQKFKINCYTFIAQEQYKKMRWLYDPKTNSYPPEQVKFFRQVTSYLYVLLFLARALHYANLQPVTVVRLQLFCERLYCCLNLENQYAISTIPQINSVNKLKKGCLQRMRKLRPKTKTIIKCVKIKKISNQKIIGRRKMCEILAIENPACRLNSPPTIIRRSYISRAKNARNWQLLIIRKINLVRVYKKLAMAINAAIPTIRLSKQEHIMLN